MTPQQLKAYEAICAADPACRCPLVHYGGRFSDSDDEKDPICWRQSAYLGWRILPDLALSAIENHLHTRLEASSAKAETERDAIWIEMDGGGWWEVNQRGVIGPIWANPNKLNVCLVAHILRLLPETFYDTML